MHFSNVFSILTISALGCGRHTNTCPISVKSWTITDTLEKVIVPGCPAKTVDAIK